MSSINFSVHAKAKDIGDNFTVRRSLPAIEKQMLGPFIFWDHMGPVDISDSKLKVRAHPHIGLATITWLFSGEIMHRDSLGNEQAIKPGEVNWMTAGSGIVHSERSTSTKIGENPGQLEGIQLWVALPKDLEDIEASFFHCSQKDLPKFTHGEINFTLIAGSFLEHSSPVPVLSSLFYVELFNQQETTWSYQLDEEDEGAIYIVRGEISLEGKNFSANSLIAFKKGSMIELNLEKETKLMFFGGKPFLEKRHIWWNFVSSSQAKIEEAKTRWVQNSFPNVINESEKIPLPN